MCDFEKRQKKDSNFAKKWQKERDGGLRKYYARHIWGMLSISLGMILADYFAQKEFSFLFFCIAVVISLCFPLIAWSANEARYRGYQRDSKMD